MDLELNKIFDSAWRLLTGRSKGYAAIAPIFIDKPNMDLYEDFCDKIKGQKIYAVISKTDPDNASVELRNEEGKILLKTKSMLFRRDELNELLLPPKAYEEFSFYPILRSRNQKNEWDEMMFSKQVFLSGSQVLESGS